MSTGQSVSDETPYAGCPHLRLDEREIAALRSRSGSRFIRTRLTICLIILLAILLSVIYLRFVGVTHERIYDTVVDSSGEIKDKLDDRYRALDEKLDRIEGKLDRLLDIANRPLPDNLRPAP